MIVITVLLLLSCDLCVGVTDHRDNGRYRRVITDERLFSRLPWPSSCCLDRGGRPLDPAPRPSHRAHIASGVRRQRINYHSVVLLHFFPFFFLRADPPPPRSSSVIIQLAAVALRVFRTFSVASRWDIHFLLFFFYFLRHWKSRLRENDVSDRCRGSWRESEHGTEPNTTMPSSSTPYNMSVSSSVVT